MSLVVAHDHCLAQGNASGATVDENVLPDFVSARIEDLCERITQLVDQKVPPSRVLVSCIHSVRDSLRRLHSLLPALLTRLFRSFLTRTAMDAMRSLFATACSQMTSELCKLHGECKNLGESSSSGLDDVLEEIAKTEQALIMNGFTALTECQPLQSLLGPDKRRAVVAPAKVSLARAGRMSRERLEGAVGRVEAALLARVEGAADSSPTDKLLEDAQKQAAKAKDAAEAVQRASYGGVATVSEAARAEDDARRAAGFAMGVEGQVAQMLAQAKHQAHDEAIATMQEVMPVVQQAARDAAKKEATTGPFSKLEKSQQEQVKATAAAASAGVGWAEAMAGATRVRDAYSRRSQDFAQAAAASEQSAQSLAMEAKEWRQLSGADPTKRAKVQRKAMRLQEEANEALTAAREEDQTLGTDEDLGHEVANQQLLRGLQAQLGAFFSSFLFCIQALHSAPDALPFAMASQGATLQNYNNELVKSIEDLREKREELNRQILKEEEDKAKIQKEHEVWELLLSELSILTDRLQKVNESLVRKTQARNEYDKTIQETEAAYMKILESSQTLLHVLKRETVNLTKNKQSSDPRHQKDRVFPRPPRPVGLQASKLDAGETVPSKEVAELDWCGVFALALVRVGRHLEVKAINKVWGVAKDLFEGETASSELQPNPTVLKATRHASQLVITHYATMSGQRLAHFFRNSVQSRNWMTVREAQEPRKVVEMVLREVRAFDTQLAKLLGDPRKPKTGVDRRNTKRFKTLA
eukprot:g13184.t1